MLMLMKILTIYNTLSNANFIVLNLSSTSFHFPMNTALVIKKKNNFIVGNLSVFIYNTLRVDGIVFKETALSSIKGGLEY